MRVPRIVPWWLFFGRVNRILRKVQQYGGTIEVVFTLPDGQKVELVFDGNPFIGKDIATIDAALCWELNQLVFP